VGNKAHLRPHRKKRQASLTTGLLLVILFIALVALAVAMVASGHALPAGRIFPLRRGRCARASRRARCVPDRGIIRGTSRLPIGQSVPGPDAAIPCTVRRSRGNFHDPEYARNHPGAGKMGDRVQAGSRHKFARWGSRTPEP
jgi:hypothetical protein